MASVYNQFSSGMSGRSDVDQHIASSKSEFQVVILAGGTNHRMLPLTEKCPKAMLPVANQPLLEFQLELVRRAGFSEVIVVTTHEHKAQVDGVVEKYGERAPTLAVDLVAVEDKKDDGSALGSADALREIKDKIKTDFMVLSGDLVAECFIHDIADVHRTSNAALTMLLKKEVAEEDPKKAGGGGGGKGGSASASASSKISKPKRDDDQVDFFGLSEDPGTDSDSKRVIFMSNKLDTEDRDDQLTVSKQLLRRAPSLTLHTDLLDAHFYVFAHWVLDLLDAKKRISSIKSELVPHLVRRQFRAAAEALPEEALASALPSELSQLPRGMSHSMAADSAQLEAGIFTASGGAGAGAGAASDDLDLVRCCAYVLPDNAYCQRANSVSAYAAMNRELVAWPVGPSTPWGRPAGIHAKFKDCQVGEGAELGEGVVLRGCVVGRNCKIGARAQLNQCVLMENVTVGDGCVIQNSVLCAETEVGKDCNMQQCETGKGTKVPAGGKHKKERLSADSEGMDEEDEE
jgi:translation initiation factor eIF-2B subunit gamma